MHTASSPDEAVCVRQCILLRRSMKLSLLREGFICFIKIRSYTPECNLCRFLFLSLWYRLSIYEGCALNISCKKHPVRHVPYTLKISLQWVTPYVVRVSGNLSRNISSLLQRGLYDKTIVFWWTVAFERLHFRIHSPSWC